MAKSLSELKDRTDVGTIIAFAGHRNPEGYLLCDGTSYNIVDKFPLFSAIGINYGGSVTGTPTTLEFMNTASATVISTDALTGTLELRLHRDKGLFGLPLVSQGITVTIDGFTFTFVSWQQNDMNTGEITLVDNLAPFNATWWSTAVAATGSTWSPSGGFVFGNSGTYTANTGWNGTFNVPDLTVDCVLAANAKKPRSNIQNTAVDGSNYHDPSIGVTVTGSVSMSVSGNAAKGNQNVGKPNATAVTTETTITNAMLQTHKHQHLIGMRAESRRYLQTGGNLTLQHTLAQRNTSTGASTDQSIASAATGSNNNNKHSHTVTVNTSGAITTNISANVLSGNVVTQLSADAVPGRVDVKNPTLTVKYLIKEF